MKKLFAIVAFTLFFISAIAQRWDANWTFGYNAGINFSDTANPVAFYSHANNREPVGCISDMDGNLLFSIVGIDNDLFSFNIVDKNGFEINNGDNIYGYQSVTNGFLILPVSVEKDSEFIIFHISSNRLSSN